MAENRALVGAMELPRLQQPPELGAEAWVPVQGLAGWVSYTGSQAHPGCQQPGDMEVQYMEQWHLGDG